MRISNPVVAKIPTIFVVDLQSDRFLRLRHRRKSFPTTRRLLLPNSWRGSRTPRTPVRPCTAVSAAEQRGATLITSQFPIAQWHDVIGDATAADAILNRLVHNAYRLEFGGKSMREPKKPCGQATVVRQNHVRTRCAQVAEVLPIGNILAPASELKRPRGTACYRINSVGSVGMILDQLVLLTLCKFRIRQ
jgi:hypothetical protein